MNPSTFPVSQVICISGSGRSGTTILSLLLSQGSDVFNLGQLRDVWTAYFKNVDCSCGHKIRSCRFWGVVINRAFPGMEVDEFRTIARAMRQFFSEAAETKGWGTPSTQARLQERHGAVIDKHKALLSAIEAETPERIFIESSTSPEFAYLLELTGAVTVDVAHYNRDPRAVAVSWYKKKDLSVAMRNAQKWKQRNQLLSAWGKTLGGRYAYSRYEDFLSDPEAACEKILSLAGAQVPAGLFAGTQQAQLDWTRQHLFPPANEAVLKEQPSSFEVIVPTSWKASEYRGVRLRALVETFPSCLPYLFRG